MSQFYSDPQRADEPHALPDCEVFYMHAGPRKAYDQAYVMDRCNCCDGHGCDECPSPGWFYQYCFPGCLPDSDPEGPFDTEEEAIKAAQEVATDGM